MKSLAYVALVLVLVACQGERSATDRAAADAGGADTTGADTASVSAIPDSAPPAARALLVLSGDGLMLINSESGATRAIAFGASAPAAIAMLTPVVGGVTERGTNEECGVGPVEFVSFSNGLQIVVQNDQFLGWTVRPQSDSTLRTMSNVGLGTTRAELESVYAADIGPSTLGMEFMAGGLQGILESAHASAKITNLWAGVACVAR